MKPLLVYDGDCGFCRRWIARWQYLTQDKVDYVSYQHAAQNFPNIPLEKFKSSVQLIETDQCIYSGAEAVFRTLAYAPGKRWPLWLYQNVPPIAWICEWFYRLAAQHRFC